MLNNKMEVEFNSELGKKVRAFEDLGVQQGLYVKIHDCISLVRQANLMGGQGGEFESKLLELVEQVRDEVNKSTNKIIGIDENTEVVITTDSRE